MYILHVLLTRCALSKPLATYCTGVRLGTCVHHLVTSQISNLRELFPTCGTSVRFFASVSAQVTRQPGCCNEPLVAHSAYMGFVSRVLYESVMFQTAVDEKFHVTYLTFEPPVIRGVQ